MVNFAESLLHIFLLPVRDSSWVCYKQISLSKFMDTEISFVKDVL